MVSVCLELFCSFKLRKSCSWRVGVGKRAIINEFLSVVYWHSRHSAVYSYRRQSDLFHQAELGFLCFLFFFIV
jgi:hypothetical protein